MVTLLISYKNIMEYPSLKKLAALINYQQEMEKRCKNLKVNVA
jgi:hypothetical protein